MFLVCINDIQMKPNMYSKLASFTDVSFYDMFSSNIFFCKEICCGHAFLWITLSYNSFVYRFLGYLYSTKYNNPYKSIISFVKIYKLYWNSLMYPFETTFFSLQCIVDDVLCICAICFKKNARVMLKCRIIKFCNYVFLPN